MEVSEYKVTTGIASELAFAWWVPYTLKYWEHIIAAINKWYMKHTHKFGIELPKMVKEALAIDKATRTTFWADAL